MVSDSWSSVPDSMNSMNPNEVNRRIEKLVSIVWRNDGAVGAVGFFNEAMKEFDCREDDVRIILRQAMDEKKLDINRAWQVIIPK